MKYHDWAYRAFLEKKIHEVRKREKRNIKNGFYDACTMMVCSRCGEIYCAWYPHDMGPIGWCLDCEEKYARECKEHYEQTINEVEKLLKCQYVDEERKKANAMTSRINRRTREKNAVIDHDITLSKLFDRCGGTCCLCGKPCDWNDYIVTNGHIVVGNMYPSCDHIKPLSKGGKHSWENVQLAHKVCNSRKWAN